MMPLVPPRASLRWKEWIPLVTQQQRLRDLIQVIAYNIDPYEKCPDSVRSSESHFYYYTLHLTTMSAPFYTSEKLESDNPKWLEIEINHLIGSAKGVVIRVWCHCGEGVERVVSVWGIYFSGLYYLGARLVAADPTFFRKNTIVLQMKGGYYTSPQAFREPPPSLRQKVESVPIASSDVKPSYTSSLLLRLQSIQQAIKQHSVAVASLRERILEGDFSSKSEQKESAVLRRLMQRTSGQPRHYQQKTVLKKEIEDVRFRVQLLTGERDRLRTFLRQRVLEKTRLVEKNLDKDIELMENYRALQKDVVRLRDLKRYSIDIKENLYSVNTVLQALRRKRISELHVIYPICEIGDAKYTICGVHLPNSEDFAGHDESMISVALGFVAHLVQMISYFLNVSLRYRIIFSGSRSKIVDHIIEDIPEKEREFPLYSTGKDKLQFNYAVYLLNKNIAQLRWYCNLTTSDLRATLHNVLGLLNLKPSYTIAGLEACKRALSSSTLELQEGGRRGINLRIPDSSIGLSLDKGLDQLDLSRIRPAQRLRSRTRNSSQPVEAPQSSEDGSGEKELLDTWAYKSPASNLSDTEGESQKSVLSSNDQPKQSPVPEESLASIISKMNPPIVLSPRRLADQKANEKLINHGIEVIEPDDPFKHQSIRQVTSKHTFLNS